MLSTYWSPAELQRLHRMLTEQRSQLLQGLHTAQLACNGELQHLRRLESEATEVELALNRLKRGVFGTCTRCGEDIAASRLRAQPAAALCHSCKQSYGSASRQGQPSEST
jgi:formylmethanofuran dehydrogenase subunit E